MSEDTFLSDEFLQQITAAGEADILAGVPTFNNARTIERTVRAIQVGLAKYFPRQRAAIVISDGGSRDGTLDQAKSISPPDFRTMLAAPPLRTMHTLATTHRAIWGRGGAFRTIFAAADLLRVKACAVISPDLESITPEWIEGLIRPIYRENVDFVAPIYLRHKFDGLLLKQILSPLIAAAYGYEIQEPYGGELAFSGRLAARYMNEGAFSREFMRQGAEVWMTTTAMAGGFRLSQSFLGPKIHAPKSGGLDLAGTIQRVVGGLFNCLETHQQFWISRNQVEAVPLFGFENDMELPAVRVDRRRMFQMFQTGVQELASVHALILSPDTLQRIREIAKLSDREFCLPDDLWVKTVYEFAASFHHTVINRDHILQALTPLYRGRISSFLHENHEAGITDLGEKLKALRLQYQQSKSYLIERWSA